MSKPIQSEWSKQQLFGWRVWKTKYELFPLLGVLSLACGMGLAFSAYSLYQKPDVRLNKAGNESPPWEDVDPEKQQKLLVINYKYKKNPELEQLRKEIGSYKY